MIIGLNPFGCHYWFCRSIAPTPINKREAEDVAVATVVVPIKWIHGNFKFRQSLNAIIWIIWSEV